MNAVEIEVAVSALVEEPFDAEAFIQAFGNKETTLKRLRKGESNKSDIVNGSELFIATVEQMTVRDASDVHMMIGETAR